MIRACIIGVSGFGAYHYMDLVREHQRGRVLPVAATVINPDEEADKCNWLRSVGCQIFADYREMLEKMKGRADLCMIPTGIPMHRPMTIAALQAGMQVFVEKPAAGAIQDVRAMEDAARGAGRIVAVGFQSLYAPNTMEAKRAILDGRIGDVQIIKGWGLWPRPVSYYERNRWAARLRVDNTWVLDSPVNNALAHDLMQMLFFAGASEGEAAYPERVEAELYRANAIESADTACLRISTSSGIPMLFFVSHATETSTTGEIEIMGSKGSIYWNRKHTIIRAEGTAEQVLPTPQGEELRSHIMDALFSAIEGKDSFYCGLGVAAAHTLTVNAAHESTAIYQIPEEFVRQKSTNGGVLTYVDGMGEVLLRGVREGKLFGEMDVPWAKAAGSFVLGNYGEFSGGKAG